MPNLSAASARNADLHCHFTMLDGMLAPHEVAARAAAHGATLWVLADHDEVGGQAAARRAVTTLGMNYSSSVEVSMTWVGRTLHIVGLSINPGNADLAQGLEHTHSSRCARIESISATLARFGIEDAYGSALWYAGNPDVVPRTHFACFLVEHDHCRDVHEVFGRYLGDGKPGYMPHRWTRLTDAINWIRGTGDIVAMAHSGRYTLSLVEHGALSDEFKALGGEGVEVATDSHVPNQYALYADVAHRYGLLASRGPDFHGPGEGRAELDTLPPPSDNLTPVWSRRIS